MKALILFFVAMCTVAVSHAQVASSSDNNAVNKLQGHYYKLKNNSNSYQEHKKSYKVIEVKDLEAFWENVQHTIRLQENNFVQAGKNTTEELTEAKEKIAEQAKQIEALKLENARKDKALQQNDYEVANILVFGVGIDKQIFMIVSFSIIAILIVVAAVMSNRYKNSQVITDEKIRDFEEIEKEFTDYKKTARDREIKVKRDLQTELNLKEELLKEMAALRQKVA